MTDGVPVFGAEDWQSRTDAEYAKRMDAVRQEHMAAMPADVRERLDAERQRVSDLESDLANARQAEEAARAAVVDGKVSGTGDSTALEKAWSRATKAREATAQRLELARDVAGGIESRYLDDRQRDALAETEAAIAACEDRGAEAYGRAVAAGTEFLRAWSELRAAAVSQERQAVQRDHLEGGRGRRSDFEQHMTLPSVNAALPLDVDSITRARPASYTGPALVTEFDPEAALVLRAQAAKQRAIAAGQPVPSDEDED